MRRIINGKAYDTKTADLIADDEFSDGNNQFSHGRASYLYRTPKGNFFAVHVTCWQGEHDSIRPLTKGEAKEMFESLLNQGDWEAAFGEPPEEA